ncbi:MAG: alpha-L-arabinofuranosidase C-terminal domain-containing protein [Limisphaerales bacterium]
MTPKTVSPLALVLAFLAAPLTAAEPPALTLHADRPGPAINPQMWGVFFEDINFGADGGLYAERVKNRGFEFPEPLMGWAIENPAGTGVVEVRNDDPFTAKNARYVRVRSSGSAATGLVNEGFRGIGLRGGERYDFSTRIRVRSGEPALRVELRAPDGRVLADARLRRLPGHWGKVTATLRPASTEPQARLFVGLEGEGEADLDFVSLFPRQTWKQRPGGLRADMVQALADLRPGFLRFPGGCIVEGFDLGNRYQWKNTIGPVEERPTMINRWNIEFKHRLTPDYFQSFGLGFYEYFLLSEDLGAAPLPILNCGMACQFNTGQLVPLAELDPYIQDALDLIEFANGPVTSKWGARRAAMGHPQPFHLRLLGIGNEQWGPQYLERYLAFARVLRERHPEIQLVSAVGPDPDDERFRFLWRETRALPTPLQPAFVDEHFYRPPAWFYSAANRYDRYDRRGPKVFAGEYAAHDGQPRTNNLRSALAEAAAMTGFERNADVVRMASYAPLFAHVDAWQWRPNLIWVDNLRVVRTPNYHVQQLFSRNRGDAVVPLTDTGLPDRVFASAVRDPARNEVILKLVNASDRPVPVRLNLAGVRALRGPATIVTLSGQPGDENTFDQPDRIAPRTTRERLAGTGFVREFAPHSLTVLRMPVR